MIIEISAEPYSVGIRAYNEGRDIDKGETSISNKTWEELRNWYKAYEKYNSKTLAELSSYWDEIDKLDQEGIYLTKRIANEWFPDVVEKFYYFSLCRDILKYILYKDGTEKNY